MVGGKIMGDCTWEKVDGRYKCMAKKCKHWTKKGCELGKISLSCINNECKFNVEISHGVYRCSSMDVFLDADGKCLCLKTF